MLGLTPARRVVAGALAIAVAAVAGKRLLASDHQDTPEVELNPRMDINDVFAFPGTGVSSVLIPDMLLVFPNRNPSTSGWLGWALANGWGGRNLSDDVVDAGLAAVFGSLLNASNTSPGLSTDNVGANDKAFSTTFPYLAAPTQ